MPYARWSRRVKRGRASLHGRFVEAIDFKIGDTSVQMPAGPAFVDMAFSGGPKADIHDMSIRVHDVALVVAGGRLAFCGDDLGAVAPGTIALTAFEALADVRIDARAEPDGDLIIELGAGVQVQIAATSALTVRGTAMGPPGDLRLSEPLTVAFGGEGLVLSHDSMGWLARLANIRLVGATLHPDGEVDLDGGNGGRVFDRAVRGGLHKASVRLSDMVRTSPKFGKVRAFLRHSER